MPRCASRGARASTRAETRHSTRAAGRSCLGERRDEAEGDATSRELARDNFASSLSKTGHERYNLCVPRYAIDGDDPAKHGMEADYRILSKTLKPALKASN